MKTKITLGIIALACTQAMAADLRTSIFTTDLSTEAKNLNLSGSCDSANCNVPSMSPPIMTGAGSSTALSQAVLANQTQTITCQVAGYDATHSGTVNQTRNVYVQNGSVVPGTESAWATTADTCQQVLSEAQTIACPAPQTGTITQARSYFAKAGIKIAGTETAWSNISNTCITPVVKSLKDGSYFICAINDDDGRGWNAGASYRCINDMGNTVSGDWYKPGYRDDLLVTNKINNEMCNGRGFFIPKSGTTPPLPKISSPGPSSTIFDLIQTKQCN